MDNRPFDTTDAEQDALPESDQWTDAELTAYGQMEDDLHARFLEKTMGVRKFFRRPSKFMEEMLLMALGKKNPTIR